MTTFGALHPGIPVPIDAEALGDYQVRNKTLLGSWSDAAHGAIVSIARQQPPIRVPGGCLRYDIFITDKDIRCESMTHQPKPGHYHAYEFTAGEGTVYIYGILLESTSTDSCRMPLRNFYAKLLLHTNADLYPKFQVPPPASTEQMFIARCIAALFEQTLLLRTVNMKGWTDTGCRTFCNMAEFWIKRDLPIQMALPAFPCKTTNRDKAAVSVPDGGEFEALTLLLTFCQRVQRIYQPGCHLHIVSDGHVFSDCIGAHDDTVTKYTMRLKIMLEEVERQQGNHTERASIKFCNLRTLLKLDEEGAAKESLTSEMSHKTVPPVNHPVTTQIDCDDDLCRRVLMGLFSPPMAFVRDLIKDVPQHPLTALYRGFSRFMFEDLACHEDSNNQTKSQRGRAAEHVAREMIIRNQAYSRLVERVLPVHIRLSIHGHDSAGPKYPIQLFPSQTVSDSQSDLVKAVVNAEAVHDTLHVPTPWHGTLTDIYTRAYHGGFRVEKTVVCKASLVTSWLVDGSYVGGYNRSHPRGGRFMLLPTSSRFVQAPGVSPEPFDIAGTAVKAATRIVVSEDDFRLHQRFEFK